MWSPFELSRILLRLLVMVFLSADAPLILLINGTLERRWGRRIAYKGRFHDAVRSQRGHVVTVLWHPLGMSDAVGSGALVSAPLGIACSQHSLASLQPRALNSANDIGRRHKPHSS